MRERHDDDEMARRDTTTRCLCATGAVAHDACATAAATSASASLDAEVLRGRRRSCSPQHVHRCEALGCLRRSVARSIRLKVTHPHILNSVLGLSTSEANHHRLHTPPPARGLSGLHPSPVPCLTEAFHRQKPHISSPNASASRLFSIGRPAAARTSCTLAIRKHQPPLVCSRIARPRTVLPRPHASSSQVVDPCAGFVFISFQGAWQGLSSSVAEFASSRRR